MNSDDLIQYYPYVSGFFDKIKQGNVSLYDTSLFGGVSFFSAAYYIPLDIFTFIAFSVPRRVTVLFSTTSFVPSL